MCYTRPEASGYLTPSANRSGARLLAGLCAGSAWLTLVVCVLTGIGLLLRSAIPPPSLPVAGLEGGGAAQTQALMALLTPLLGGVRVVAAIAVIGTGVGGFFALMVLAQALYLLLDVEQNTRVTAQALAALARRSESR
jgi:hypothetical protein